MRPVAKTVSFTRGWTSDGPDRGIWPWWYRLGWLGLIVGWLGLASAARGGEPQVAQLRLQHTSEGLSLAARFSLDPGPTLLGALHKGVPLYFVWHADVVAPRWYWRDRRVASATRVLRLAHQPLTRQWRVSLSHELPGSGSGVQYALHQNHEHLEQALAAVGRVARWKLAEAPVIEGLDDLRVELRFRLDLGLLPRPLQIGMSNQPDWVIDLQRTLKVPPLRTEAVEGAGDGSQREETMEPGRW